MGVNWKQGLLRAWVALSVVWLVLVGIGIFIGLGGLFRSLPELPETGMIEKSVDLACAYRSGIMPKDEVETVLPPGRPLEDQVRMKELVEEKKELVDALREERLRLFQAQLEQTPPSRGWEMRKTIKGFAEVLCDPALLGGVATNVPSDIEAKEIGRRISNLFQDARSEELRSRILETSAWLFIPPAVLFVVGIGIYWVVVGFKKGT